MIEPDCKLTCRAVLVKGHVAGMNGNSNVLKKCQASLINKAILTHCHHRYNHSLLFPLSVGQAFHLETQGSTA